MKNTENTPQERLDNFIKENKIELKTNFIPFSFSRDADKIDIKEEKDKLYRALGLTLNWNVTLSGNKNNVNTEYSKGIGHLGYNWISSSFKIKLLSEAKFANELLFEAIEKGVCYNIKTIEQFTKKTSILKKVDFPTPNITDILECMVLDSSSLEHHTFESWANEMGGNPDSRAEEKIFNKCKDISIQFLKVVGGKEKLQELSEILYDIENNPKAKSKLKP